MIVSAALRSAVIMDFSRIERTPHAAQSSPKTGSPPHISRIDVLTDGRPAGTLQEPPHGAANLRQNDFSVPDPFFSPPFFPLHRFLIHNILSRRGFTPAGIMFPVSAVMLKRMDAYDDSLEAFSRPLMPLVEFSLDEQGRMTVQSETADLYRYMDLTAQAEALFGFVAETIEVELVEELRFLVNYDNTKRAIQEIVDMPDRLVDLFIRFCLQNNGNLSARKRSEYFKMLSDDEVTRMETAVRDAYQPR